MTVEEMARVLYVVIAADFPPPMPWDLDRLGYLIVHGMETDPDEMCERCGGAATGDRSYPLRAVPHRPLLNLGAHAEVAAPRLTGWELPHHWSSDIRQRPSSAGPDAECLTRL